MAVQVAATELSNCRVMSWGDHGQGWRDGQGSGAQRAGVERHQPAPWTAPARGSSVRVLLFSWGPRIRMG